MNYSLVKVNAFIKGLVWLSRPHVWLGWLRHPFFFLANTISLSRWMASQHHSSAFNDFFTFKRVITRRLTLYQNLVDTLQLEQEAFDYLEYGVSTGLSLQWWVDHTKHADTRYYGFDTFEGLPEDFGFYVKGSLASLIPDITDTRVKFYKGLFQDTQPIFIKEINLEHDCRKIIHLDADLFTSTLYALTSLAPYLKKGDVLMFDEFSVPNHEFLAFKIFCESYYIKTRLLGAVNNYFQVAFIIE